MQSSHQFHQHPNGIMTAPRPGRFVTGENNRGLESIDNINSVPRKNLFSPNVNGGSIAPPPLLPQSNSKMANHYQQIALHNEENRINSSYTPMKSLHGHAALAPFTPERRTPHTATKISTPGGLRDSAASHQCGLSAMISLETSYRTPCKSTTKKKHRRNPSTVSRLFPTPTSATPMRTPATTTKKHKRSTTSSVLIMSTPTRTTVATPMRTSGKNNHHTSNTSSVNRELMLAQHPNSDTKVTTKPSHRRTPNGFQFTPQKRGIVEDEDLSSASCSSDELFGSSGHNQKEVLSSSSTMQTEENVPPPPAPPQSTATKATPKQKLRRTIPLPSPNLPGRSARKKLKKQMTPPRNYYSSHAIDTSSSPDEMGLLRTGFAGLEMYRMTSTELEPSNFQVELPSKKEVLVHAKICNLLDGYTATQRDFNFAMLSGITRSTLEKEYTNSTNENPMIAGICHRDVVKQVLECADDLVVEGFFREYGRVNKEEGDGERIEACVFSSESLRQIIVCFRGSTVAQARPVKSHLFGKEGEYSVKDDECIIILVHCSF